ncbi:macrophage mannose receptor 1-like [Haliotis asinina]|uniref:macrophage mannose receptor 1-like n=1 Tax=Haliotis asinina TaxID=109174 RepID=UPI003531F311
MATAKMVFDLVLITTLPTDYNKVIKVESALDCALECIRKPRCDAMAFSAPQQVCYLYKQSFQGDPTATSNMDLLLYNIKRGTECNEVFASSRKSTNTVCDQKKGYSYEPNMNVCYKYHSSEKFQHAAAKDICINEGASNLLKVNSDEKQAFFTKLVPSGSYAYIQGDRRDSTGEWVYWEETTAAVMSYTNWADGQPNGAQSGQNCISIDATGQHDAGCHYYNYFFCEKYM